MGGTTVKHRELLFILAFAVLLAVAIGSYVIFNDSKSSEPQKKNGLIQLTEEGRQDATTMVLLDAPPMQGADHKDRWVLELRHEACLTCHGKEGTGAPTPPKDHYYNNDVAGKIFRDNCVQCHAEQNEVAETAFNKNK